MATCTAIKLAIQGSEAFADAYVLKLCLSEGISLPTLAKLTLISSAPLNPRQLHALLGSLARVEIVQDNVLSRYFHGQITAASFVQKASKQLDSGKGQNYSYVYDLSLASSLLKLQQIQHLQLQSSISHVDLIKHLLEHDFADALHQCEFASDLESRLRSALGQDSLGLSTLHSFTQDSSAYALFLKALYFIGGNYCLIQQPDDFKEQLYISSGLEVHNNKPWLYSEGQAVDFLTEFDIDQEHSSLKDLSYSFEGTVPDKFAFLMQPEALSGALTAPEIQALATDPFLQQLQPTQFAHTAHDYPRYSFYQQGRLTKLRQLQFESEVIAAQAAHLGFQPGVRFTVNGMGDPLKLMVRRSTLLAVAPFPTERAYPAPTHAEKILHVGLSLLDEQNYTQGPGCLLSAQEVLNPVSAFDTSALVRFEKSHTKSAAASGHGFASNLGGAGSSASDANAPLKSSLNEVQNLQSALAIQNTQQTLANQIQVLNATVCTNTGETSGEWKGHVFLSNLDNVKEPSQIFACLQDTQKIVLVEILLSFSEGGALPRVGTPIKILAVQGHYLYLGQGVKTYKNAFDEAERLRQLYSQHWQLNQPQNSTLNLGLNTLGSKQIAKTSATGTDTTTSSSSDSSTTKATSSQQISPDGELGIDYLDSVCDVVMYHYTHGSLDHLAFNQATQINDAKLLREYDKAKAKLDSLYTAMLTAESAYESAHDAYFKALAEDASSAESLDQERSTKSDTYVDAYNQVYDQAANIAELLQLRSEHGCMMTHLYSKQGSINLGTDQGQISVLGANVNIAADQQTISGKTLTLNADDKIVLSVGGNSISLDRNGITLESRKWTGVSGMLDATIFMDSISGVSISGMSTSLSGALGVQLSDAFGASLGLANGSAQLAGMSCQLSSSAGGSGLRQMIIFGTTFVNEMISMALNLTGNQSTLSGQIQKAVYFGANDTSAFYKSFKAMSAESEKMNSPASDTTAWYTTVANLCKCILNYIITCINWVEHFMMSFFGSTLNKVVSESCPNYTVRDAIRTVSGSLKFINSIICTSALCAANGLKAKNATLSLSPSEINLNSQNLKFVSESNTMVNKPSAGNALENPGNEEDKDKDKDQDNTQNQDKTTDENKKNPSTDGSSEGPTDTSAKKAPSSSSTSSSTNTSKSTDSPSEPTDSSSPSTSSGVSGSSSSSYSSSSTTSQTGSNSSPTGTSTSPSSSSSTNGGTGGSTGGSGGSTGGTGGSTGGTGGSTGGTGGSGGGSGGTGGSTGGTGGSGGGSGGTGGSTGGGTGGSGGGVTGGGTTGTSNSTPTTSSDSISSSDVTE